jgi:hypothetical protein
MHKHSAHCESGVMSSLLTHNGYPVSEAMAFGIGNGLSFAYLPMVKLDGMPLVAYRMLPRGIIKALTKRLGITLNIKRYSSPLKAQNELIDMVDSGKIVGLQTSVYWLPYFPTEMRFHFNAHNLIVYGREEENFLIGDPVFEHTVSASFNDLTKARFAKGVFAPKGTCYTIGEIPKDIDLSKVIKKSIKHTTRMMLNSFLPWIGIRGMNKMKREILALPKRPKKYASLYLGHIIRMQEEIGTGGGGFRLMYAAFLLEASALLQNEDLKSASQMMRETGDAWRRFALCASQACRGDNYKISEIADALQEAITLEKNVHKFLRGLKL